MSDSKGHTYGVQMPSVELLDVLCGLCCWMCFVGGAMWEMLLDRLLECALGCALEKCVLSGFALEMSLRIYKSAENSTSDYPMDLFSKWTGFS